jgi:hypothetical protein
MMRMSAPFSSIADEVINPLVHQPFEGVASSNL